MNDDCVVSSGKNVVENNGTEVKQSGDYHSVSGMAAHFRRPVWEPLQLQENHCELGSTPTLLRTRTPVSFESKYTLCFTSDLSESSGEEQELAVNHIGPSYSNEKLEHYSKANSSDEHWSNIDADTDDLYRLSMEKKLKDLVSTANDLIFSDEFEDESFSEKDNLSDNVTLKTEDASVRSTPESTPSRGSAVTGSNCQLYTAYHRNSPLYAMTVNELNEFLKQIKSKMNG